MKKRKLIFGLLMAAFLIASSITLYSCYPYGSTNPTDYDVVATLHQTDLNSYKNYRTYIMNDDVVHISDGTPVSSPEIDNAIRTTVAANMQSYGYTRITNPADTASADLVVRLAITNNTTYFTNTYYGGYYGYYYYPWTTVYSVTTGSVLTTIIDKKTTAKTAVWMGIVNGTSDGNTSAAVSRITAGINTSFSQSPYLKVN
jgi:hypothetical protein